MIHSLDFKIFGSGHGLAAPVCSQPFFWLVDARTQRGAFYSWYGWFGCQLASIQWTHPNAYERRTLAGKDFRPWRSERRWGRVLVCWAAEPEFLDSESIDAFKKNLMTYGD